MKLLKNTQTQVELVEIEGVPQPFFDGKGHKIQLVRKQESDTIISVDPDLILDLPDAPTFEASDGHIGTYPYPDYAHWCHNCQIFIGWASQVALRSYCNTCADIASYNILIKAEVDLYATVQEYHWFFQNPDWRDDDYHDGMYNAHAQRMERLRSRWLEEGALHLMSRIADSYSLEPRAVIRFFVGLSEIGAVPLEDMVAAI
jgi:hypothetical protein